MELKCRTKVFRTIGQHRSPRILLGCTLRHGQANILTCAAGHCENGIRGLLVDRDGVDRQRPLIVRQWPRRIKARPHHRVAGWCQLLRNQRAVRVARRYRRQVREVFARAIVCDGADAFVAGATGVGGSQLEGLAVVGRGVVRDRHPHQQIGRFASRAVGIGRHLHIGACGVAGPGAAVPVFECVGVVAARCGGVTGSSIQIQFDVLAFIATDREHRIR